MFSFITKRITQVIPVLIAASFIIFLMVRALPGDPALMYAGPDATDEMVEALRLRMGLDKPILQQYLIWLVNSFKGDFGKSMISGMQVSFLLSRAIPATLILTFTVLFFSVFIAIPLGIISAIKDKKFIDGAIDTYVAISLALPNFWLGILLILLFSVKLSLLPSSGYTPLSENFAESIRYLILPAVALGNRLTAEITRFVKSSILETFKEDFIRTAKAKGLGIYRLTFQHVLRNALIPIVTMIGMRFGRLLGGAVIVETVFSWPGVGRLIANAIGQRDYPMIQAGLMFVILIYIIINLCTDLLYGIIDPRISLDRKKG